MMQRRATTQIHLIEKTMWILRVTRMLELKFVFEKHRRALGSLIELQGKQSQNVSGSGFQLGNHFLCFAAKEGIKNHRWNTDRQSSRRVDQRLTDSSGKRDVAGASYIGSKRAERSDNSEHGA